MKRALLMLAVLSAGAAAAQEGDPQTSPMLAVPVSGQDTMGTATLTRFSDRLELSIETFGAGLSEGMVISIWWAVFNRPEHCVDGCGADDMFTTPGTPTEGDMLGSRGEVVAGDTLRLTSQMWKGSAELSARPFYQAGLGLGDGIRRGLLNPLAAEVHIVLRSHGPVNEAFLEEQLSTFEGGCFVNLPVGTYPTEAGECANVQIAFFHAPQVGTVVETASWSVVKEAGTGRRVGRVER